MNRLKIYANTEPLPKNYTASQLGLIDEIYGNKRRIHNVSYPPSGTESINKGIPECYRTIAYNVIDRDLAWHPHAALHDNHWKTKTTIYYLHNQQGYITENLLESTFKYGESESGIYI